MDHGWQQRHQKCRIGRAEDEIAAEQADIGGAVLPAVANLLRRRRCSLWIDAPWRHRLETAHGEGRGGRQQHEIALFEYNLCFPVDGEAASAFEHGAEAGLAEFRITHAPRAGAADPLREHGARLQQLDDLGERVGGESVCHFRTVANKIRTID